MKKVPYPDSGYGKPQYLGVFCGIGIQIEDGVDQCLTGKVVGHIRDIPAFVVNVVHQSFDTLHTVFVCQTILLTKWMMIL